MATLNVIRRWALRDQMSIREISRRTGLARNTVKKYLRSDETEPSYERRVSSSKLDPYAEKLATWLGIEATKSRKQRRTLRQIHTDSTQKGENQELIHTVSSFCSQRVWVNIRWKTRVRLQRNSTQLHHLKKRIEKIRGVVIKKCPSLSDAIDSTLLRKSTKLLNDYFPEIDGLRDAMAHAGEFDAHPEVHAPDGMFALKGFREPHRFSAPFKRKLYHLDITDETLTRITEVVVLFFEGFMPASAMLEAQGHVE